jgi:hypothetical protein
MGFTEFLASRELAEFLLVAGGYIIKWLEYRARGRRPGDRRPRD